MTTGKTGVLVLGGSGMLGSMVVDLLARDTALDVTATARSEVLRQSMATRYPGVRWRVFDPSRGIASDLFDRQGWAINAIGITKPLIRDDRADEVERAIEINARAPHLLGHAAVAAGTRIVQIATDCVYSGAKGAYVETDAHDALDVYGKTKSLGEAWLDNIHHLRCSIIGPEPKDFKFLIEWFRRQPHGAALKGFVNHWWNGVTTLQFARLCRGLLHGGPAPVHLLHVVPTGSVSKAQMLHQFAEVYGRRDLSIEDVSAATVVDRTLSTTQPELNAALWKAAGYAQVPTVPDMIRELATYDYRAVGMMPGSRLALVLGIRPDVIRASLILEQLRQYGNIDVTFIWSGQHYSDNLKSIFFRELDVAPAEVDLGCSGDSDATIVASVIARLPPVLMRLQPAAVVFLGDTNTTTGALAAAQLNIPIVHIEGCMRSYDWRMPEEKYRTTIDHLSDVIYAYFDEYKEQGVREGLNPDSIVVVGNPIVDVLNRYYYARKARFDAMATPEFFASRALERGQYCLMTCHRRENLGPATFQAIVRLLAASPRPVYFPASYRTQGFMRESGVRVPGGVHVVDPIGYEEMLCLLVNARAVITDSGTVVEEACVLQVPSVQMRRSTERPQVYDAGSSVKFDPTEPNTYPPSEVFRKVEALVGRTWRHGLGDGLASKRIAEDLHRRLVENDFARHTPAHYHVPIARSYREDGLE